MLPSRDAIYRSHGDGEVVRASHPVASGRTVLRKKVHENFQSSFPADLSVLSPEETYLFPTFPPLAALQSAASGVQKPSVFSYMADYPLALITSQDNWPLASTLRCHRKPASCVPAGAIFYGRISHEICHLPKTASVGFAALIESVQWPCFDFATRVGDFDHRVLPVNCNSRVPGHVTASPAHVLGLPEGTPVYADVVLSSDYLSRAFFALCFSTETAPSAGLVYNLGCAAAPLAANGAFTAAWRVSTDAHSQHLWSPEEACKPPEKNLLKNFLPKLILLTCFGS